MSAEDPRDPEAARFIDVPEDYDPTTENPKPTQINSVQRTPKPWHRPRKQYVRRSQWATSLAKLIEDVRFDRAVLYLGLPGDEFLDVRYLADGPITDAGLKLRFLGFNNTEEAAAQVETATASTESALAVAELSALEETRNHPSIDEISDVQPDDIRRLATVGSPAYLAVDKFGPFDIVNLDLTQSVFAKRSGRDAYTLAIQHLFGLQARASHDWLLWMTTRVDRDAVHDPHPKQLLELVQGRFVDCPALLELWTDAQFDATEPADIDIASCSERDFAAIVFIGLCLWLHGLGEAPVRQPMKIVSAFRYRVHPSAASPDMFSLVIRVSPQVAIPIDNSGLTPPAEPSTAPDKCEQLARVMSRYHAGIDIEERIRNDPRLRELLIDETASLLELLRIDRATYIRWVNQYPA